MVTMNLKVWISQDKYSEALNNLNALIEPTRVQPGCISCHIYKGLESKSPILLIEEWEDDEQLRNYMRSEDFKVILAMIELSVEKPEFKLNTVIDYKGIDNLAQFSSLS